MLFHTIETRLKLQHYKIIILTKTMFKWKVSGVYKYIYVRISVCLCVCYCFVYLCDEISVTQC